METNLKVLDAISGLNFPNIEDGALVAEAIVFVKVIQENGRPLWQCVYSDGVSAYEALGVLRLEIQATTDCVLYHDHKEDNDG